MAQSFILDRKSLANCLNRLKGDEVKKDDVMRDPEFAFYHRNRNFFNNKYSSDIATGMQVTLLEKPVHGIYTDNIGRKWTEIVFGIVYHRPFKTVKDKTDYVKDLLKPANERYARKFIRPDEFMVEAGYDGGCEFELIIRNKEIVNLGPYMQTYNFGETGAMSTYNGLHGKFDVSPHEKSPVYEIYPYGGRGKVEIID